MANDSWISELTSHPFISSKIFRLILIGREAWKGYIFDETEEQASQTKERD